MCICFLGNIGPKADRGVQICIANVNATRLCMPMRKFSSLLIIALLSLFFYLDAEYTGLQFYKISFY